MEDLLARVVSEAQRRYYGKYRGFVVSNADPRKLGRLRLRVPSVLGDAVTGWALPCLPYGGLAGQGLFLLPEKGAQVWVEFEEGVLDAPIWVGTFWQPGGERPGTARTGEPTTRVLRTAAGHVIQLQDAEDEREILISHPAGATVRIDDSGTVALSDAGGGSLVLDAEGGKVRVEDANGNTVTMSSDGVVVQDASGGQLSLGASGAVLKATKITLDAAVVELGGAGGVRLIGQDFLSMYGAHVHPAGTPSTGPPTPPPVPPPVTLAVSAT